MSSLLQFSVLGSRGRGYPVSLGWASLAPVTMIHPVGGPAMTPESPADLETDPRFPSGKWAGFWTTTVPIVSRPKQEMVLTFAHGEIKGEGRDMIGKFLIRGFYSTTDGKCRWTKKYVGRHDVYYQGFNEGKGIWGVSSIDQ